MKDYLHTVVTFALIVCVVMLMMRSCGGGEASSRSERIDGHRKTIDSLADLGPDMNKLLEEVEFRIEDRVSRIEQDDARIIYVPLESPSHPIHLPIGERDLYWSRWRESHGLSEADYSPR